MLLKCTRDCDWFGCSLRHYECCCTKWPCCVEHVWSQVFTFWVFFSDLCPLCLTLSVPTRRTRRMLLPFSTTCPWRKSQFLAPWIINRRFPDITGKDNLTVFSYSGRVKSPEWRRQLRRADLRQFEIFRHEPVIIYTRVPAGGTYYPICTFPTSSERLIGISDAFSAFVYGSPSSCTRAHCTPNKSVTTLRYTRRHGPVYIQAMPVGTY